MAERPDTRQLDIADCETDFEAAVAKCSTPTTRSKAAYRLEVSSPGIDRPLTRLKDYRDWAGMRRASRSSSRATAASSISGIARGLDGDTVKLTGKDGQVHALPFSDIASAKLLLTDKLIKATAPLSTEGAEAIKMEG